LKGSLGASGEYLDLFWERDKEIFLFESRNRRISGKQQNFPKQQNLSSNEIRTEKSLDLFPEKRLPKTALIRRGCPSRAVYYFKIW